MDYVTRPVELSWNRFGQVPKVYIECLNDAAIGISAQRAMTSGYSGTTVLTLDTGHSPFLSSPGKLANVLASLQTA